MEYPNRQKQIFTYSEGLSRAAKYCAYQERSQREVSSKLKEWGLSDEYAENILAELISQGYLNEERFAVSFVRGKFRVKKWGRLKIKSELKLKGVSEFCIRTGMKEIDADTYYNTLKELIMRKNKEIKESNKIKRVYLLTRFAYSKGYEQDLIMDVIKELEIG